MGLAEEALNDFADYYDEEIETLDDVISSGEDSPDWSHGEVLIHENLFQEHIEDMIKDCYEMPKIGEGWPWNHLTMDWWAASEEAKGDYFEIEAEGETYYIRS